MKIIKRATMLFILTLFFAFTLVAISSDVSAEEIEVPNLLTFVSYDVGSSGYMQASFISEAIMENYDCRVRIQPSANPVSRHYPVRNQEAEVAFTGLDAWAMQEGIMEYKEQEWGPQPVRMLWFSHSGGIPLAVRGDSDISEVSDLKGKRVPTYPGSEVLTAYVEACLAFGDLTYEDVQPVEVSGYVAAQDMAMQGDIDVALIGVETPKAYEWHSMKYGIRWLEMDHSDEEGWARIKEVLPPYAPLKATIGPGIAKEEPLDAGQGSSPRMMAYDWLDEDVAYFITKSMVELYDDYAPKHDAMEQFWTIDQNLQLFKGGATPFHEGSVRYFKEIGEWTEELEELNQKRLQRQNNLRSLWEETVEKGIEKEISAKEFPKFWLEKRKAAGF